MIRKHARRLSLFSAFGLLTFAIGMGMMFVFVSMMGMKPSIAYILQTFITLAMYQTLNWRYTWNDRQSHYWISMYRFVMSRAVTIALSIVAFAFLVNHFDMHYQIANILVSALAQPVNFIISDKWLFPREEASTA